MIRQYLCVSHHSKGIVVFPDGLLLLHPRGIIYHVQTFSTHILYNDICKISPFLNIFHIIVKIICSNKCFRRLAIKILCNKFSISFCNFFRRTLRRIYCHSFQSSRKIHIIGGAQIAAYTKGSVETKTISRQ